MVKVRSLGIILFIVLILGSMNVYLYISKGKVSYSVLSGRFVEKIPEIPIVEKFQELPLTLNLSLVAFVVQWILLVLIVIIAYLKFLKHRKQEHIKLTYGQIKNQKLSSRSKTDLDILYNLLEKQKKLRIGAIAKTFKITNEKALEWAKILENSELAIVEYPAFNEPEIILKEKEVKDEEEKEIKKGEEKPEKEGKKRKQKAKKKEKKRKKRV